MKRDPAFRQGPPSQTQAEASSPPPEPARREGTMPLEGNVAMAAPARSQAAATGAAGGAFLLGVLYAAVSGYWALGGTGLLDTVGGTLEREGLAGNRVLLAAAWLTVALKLIAAVLGLVAVAGNRRLPPPHLRLARRAAWAVALILAGYGGLLTLLGLAVQSGAVPTSAHADRQALRWHAYLWDPWFLIWGLLLIAALGLSRRPLRVGPRPII